MAISNDGQSKYIHRKYGYLFYDIADLPLDEDLIIDPDGTPNQTQNPNAVYIGYTDGGYDFTAEPTFAEEVVDEEETPIDISVEGIAAQISFDALEVVDLERIAEMVPFGNYSENTDSAKPLHKRITAGGSRLSLPSRPVVVISPEKAGGFLYVILYKAYNSAAHTLQFKKTERAKQSMVFKGLADSTRDDGDRIYREGYQTAVLTIPTATPLPAATTAVLMAPVAFSATGGLSPYVWDISAGAVGTGLAFSSAGVLSGTPVGAGTRNFTVRATDENGIIITKAMSLVVGA